jgi:hypothetical protein
MKLTYKFKWSEYDQEKNEIVKKSSVISALNSLNAAIIFTNKYKVLEYDQQTIKTKQNYK